MASRTRGHTRGSRWLLGAALFAVALVFALVPGISFAANPAANLDQCANGSDLATASSGCNTLAADWVNGNLGSSKSAYREGDSIPYRLTFSSLSISAPHAVTIEWDTTKSGKHAIDYIDTFNQSVTDANPCLGVSGCNPLSFSTDGAIPVDPQVSGAGVTPIAGNFRLYGGTITSLTRPSAVGNTSCTNANSAGSYCYSTGTGFSGDKSAAITINFTASVANPVLAWGGHIATRKDWGNSNSAVAISGSPYHTRLIDLDGSGGNQDRSLSAAAVIFPGFIHVVKNTTGGDSTFGFTASPSPLANCSITTSGGTGGGPGAAACFFDNITTFQTYTVSENAPTLPWAFDSVSCADAADNGGTSSISSRTATINMNEGEQWTCTYANHFVASPGVSIVKSSSDTTFDSAGDVLHYSYLVTNTGNVALTGISVTDDNTDAAPSCPSSTLAVGAHETCTAQHTVTQAEVDAAACSVINHSSVTSDQGAGDTSNYEIDGACTPGISLVKSSSDTTFSAAGDVLTYSYLVTNTGKVTLTGISVTDDNTDAAPVCLATTLAPGASTTCSAQHTVTQAEVDAAACSVINHSSVTSDQGAGDTSNYEIDGACTPGISLVKSSSDTTFSAAGAVLHYSYLVTNTGNVTATGIVVTDNNVDSAPVCLATTLAPGASTTCSAQHTVTSGEVANGCKVTNSSSVSDDQGSTDSSDYEIDGNCTPQAQILPTNTTCQQYVLGQGQSLASLTYGVKSNKISNVAPGVFFYYSFVTVASNGSTLTVPETNLLGWKPIKTLNTQAFLYNTSCTKLGITGTESSTSTTDTITYSNVPAGTYVIGIKYDPSTIVGQSVTKSGGHYPTNTYSYITKVNGTDFGGSGAGINVVPK